MCSIKICLFRLAEMLIAVLLEIPGLRAFFLISAKFLRLQIIRRLIVCDQNNM